MPTPNSSKSTSCEHPSTTPPASSILKSRASGMILARDLLRPAAEIGHPVKVKLLHAVQNTKTHSTSTFNLSQRQSSLTAFLRRRSTWILLKIGQEYASLTSALQILPRGLIRRLGGNRRRFVYLTWVGGYLTKTSVGLSANIV